MSIRRFTAVVSITLAGATLALPATPANAADLSRDAIDCARGAWEEDDPAVRADMLTLAFERSTALAGMDGYVQEVVYDLPSGYACEILRLHVPAARSGQKITVDFSWSTPRHRVDADADVTYTGFSGYVNGGVVPTRDVTYVDGSSAVGGQRVLSADVFRRVESGGPDQWNDSAWTDTRLGTKWTVKVAAEASTKTVTTPATPDAVAAATATRDNAAAASLKTKAKAIKKARKRFLNDKAAADSAKELRTARKKYTVARKKAARQHATRLVDIEKVYQAAIAPVVTTTTFSAATAAPLSGQVPPSA